MKTLVDFPDLTEDEIAHSERLIERIIQRMNGGVIAFADYMQMALFEPSLGYYAAGSTKIGVDGDFVTAPEVSSLFGQSIANAISHSFKQGLAPSILEFGAGTGKLCLDIIEALNSQNIAWDSYALLETSPDLIQRQQQFLAEKLSKQDFRKLSWLNELPKKFNGFILGNEVLDAMPVNVVVKQNGWHELGVSFEHERFSWHELSDDSQAVKTMQAIEQQHHLDLAEGYCTEVNLQQQAWLSSLYDACQHVKVLLIDYGYFQSQYYHPERKTGTMMCYFRHRAHSDPLVLPGLQDITASVDFSALAESAELLGFKVDEISSQAEFLMRHDLLKLAEKQALENPYATAQAIKTLTLPAEMGETFKAMCLSK